MQENIWQGTNRTNSVGQFFPPKNITNRLPIRRTTKPWSNPIAEDGKNRSPIQEWNARKVKAHETFRRKKTLLLLSWHIPKAKNVGFKQLRHLFFYPKLALGDLFWGYLAPRLAALPIMGRIKLMQRPPKGKFCHASRKKCCPNPSS